MIMWSVTDITPLLYYTLCLSPNKERISKIKNKIKGKTENKWKLSLSFISLTREGQEISILKVLQVDLCL